MNTSHSSTDIIIGKAAPCDFIPIAALDRIAWQESINSELIPDGEHVWRIWCEHALTYVGRTTNGEVVAALIAFPCMDESFCLHKVMVAESQRGKGLGSKLFDVLLADLDRRSADCFLTVSPANTNALKLYRSRGFIGEKFVKGYYREEEDRFVLVRRGAKASATA